MQFDKLISECPIQKPCSFFPLYLEKIEDPTKVFERVRNQIGVKRLKLDNPTLIPSGISQIAGLEDIEIYTRNPTPIVWKDSNLGKIQEINIYVRSTGDLRWLPPGENLQKMILSISFPKKSDELPHIIHLDFTRYPNLKELRISTSEVLADNINDHETMNVTLPASIYTLKKIKEMYHNGIPLTSEKR